MAMTTMVVVMLIVVSGYGYVHGNEGDNDSYGDVADGDNVEEEDYTSCKTI